MEVQNTCGPIDMVWSNNNNNLITTSYRCIFAKASATHMENDENENATPTQELPLKPKMHVFFAFASGLQKWPLRMQVMILDTIPTNDVRQSQACMTTWKYTKIKSFCGFIWSIHRGHQMPASPLHKSMIFTPKCRFFSKRNPSKMTTETGF